MLEDSNLTITIVTLAIVRANVKFSVKEIAKTNVSVTVTACFCR